MQKMVRVGSMSRTKTTTGRAAAEILDQSERNYSGVCDRLTTDALNISTIETIVIECTGYSNRVLRL